MLLFLPILLAIMSFITLKYYRNTSKRSAEDAGPSNSKKRRVKTLENQISSPDASSLTHQLIHQKQPQFEPPIRTLPLSFKVLIKEREPIDLFLRLFGWISLSTLVEQTNKRAAREMANAKCEASSPRPWWPILRGEMLRWIGILFYMGRHKEECRTVYWNLSTHNLGRFMTEQRWDQIHRFLCVRDQPTSPGAPFWAKLEPIASNIRRNCGEAIDPSFWVAIDEAMIAFRGRSSDKVKLRTKPISEGFKVWMLACKGYCYSWL